MDILGENEKVLKFYHGNAPFSFRLETRALPQGNAAIPKTLKSRPFHQEGPKVAGKTGMIFDSFLPPCALHGNSQRAVGRIPLCEAGHCVDLIWIFQGTGKVIETERI
jgi:hypothetical protein